MAPTADWSYPTAVRFGTGRIAELADACRAAGIVRPLFVTDAGLAALPITHRALEVLTGSGFEPVVFAEVRPNPVEANLAAGVEVFRDGGHDGVVAFGGGSSLDIGKLIAFMAGQVRPVWDFGELGDWWTRADVDAIAPVVAVPTTAGTGSEVGRSGVVTHERTRTKKAIFHPGMMPKVVIADPGLTVGMPPAITAGTGMDALAHCLEACCAPGFHPMSDGIAAAGVRLVLCALPRAFHDGGDIEARGDMMAAAAMGGVALQKGLGAIHALSCAVGALYDTHHGTTDAVLMPYVLAHNRPAIEDLIARLAAWLGLPDPTFDGFMALVLDLRAGIGIPHTLEGLGVDDAGTDRVVEMALADPAAGGNPVPLTETAARSIFLDALEGRVRARIGGA